MTHNVYRSALRLYANIKNPEATVWKECQKGLDTPVAVAGSGALLAFKYINFRSENNIILQTFE